MMRKLQLVLIFFLFLLGCTRKEPTVASRFQLLNPSETNVDFINRLSEKQVDIIEYAYYYNGGGVAAGDINNDGLIDIFFTANENKNKLFLNQGNFVFKDVSAAAGIEGTGDWSTGVTMADVNNDGNLDIYVSNVGGYKGLQGANELFINNGDGTFTESAKAYGLDFIGFSTQAVFFDYDRDGDLDMYLLNHSVHSVRSYGPATLRHESDARAGDRLYRNNLKEGEKRFTDVTSEAGIFNSQIGYGLGVVVGDVNDDMWPDIYVSNDFHENDYLYINQGDGTFSEQLEKRIGHTSRYAMGNAMGDLNGDNLPDIITLDMLPDDPEILQKSASEDRQEVSDIKKESGYADQYVRNAFQLNRGNGHFSEIAQLAGISATDWSWSPTIADLDNDGKNELYITNGIFKRPNDLDYIQYMGNLSQMRYSATASDSINRKLIDKMPTLKVSNYTFKSSGKYKYKNVSKDWGLAEPSYSNGAVAADLNNDGKLDLIVNNVNQQAFIYKNKGSGDAGNFLQVELRGKKSNYYGIGAKVSVYTNGHVQTQEIISTTGFQSSVPPMAHFGLGNKSKVDSIRVQWPTGKYQTLKPKGLNKKLIILEKQQGEIIQPTVRIQADTSENVVFEPVYQHIENNFKDNSREYLIPYKLSAEGPASAVGDVNGDGLDDIFFGGGKYQPGKIYLQQKDGSFLEKKQKWTTEHAIFEDVSAELFDANGDKYLDLIVISGGNEESVGSTNLQDRLYINDGKGNFTLAKDALPHGNHNGSVSKAHDIDGDGDMDLFIGNRSVPGNYGLPADQFILVNDGKGIFSIAFREKLGMVTDAAWADIDGDDKVELIVVGDWMPVTILESRNQTFAIRKGVKGLEDTFGWWKSLAIADVNGDGLPDIIAGNVGENMKMIPTKEKPVELYLADFDKNGKIDPVIFYHKQGKLIPLASKDLLAKQMPFLNKKFNSYLQYATVGRPQDLFADEAIKNSKKLYANTFKTSMYINAPSGTFSFESMPEEVQFSSVNAIFVDENYAAGTIWIGGNFFDNSVDLGRSDAQSQIRLTKTPNGYVADNFKSNTIASIRNLQIIVVSGKAYLILVKNNGKPEFIPIE